MYGLKNMMRRWEWTMMNKRRTKWQDGRTQDNRTTRHRTTVWRTLDRSPMDESPWMDVLRWTEVRRTKVRWMSLDGRKFDKCPWTDENWQCDIGGHDAVERLWAPQWWLTTTRCCSAISVASSRHCKVTANVANSRVTSSRRYNLQCCRLAVLQLTVL
jgi:hypothetical protein